MLTTQHLEEADRLADHIAVIDLGKVIAEGTPDELKKKVGPERVELTFESESDLKKARQFIKGEGLRVEEKARKLSYANTQGTSGLRQVLGQCDKAGLKITGLSLTKSSLDDVFLKLTGHKAKDTTKEKEGKK